MNMGAIESILNARTSLEAAWKALRDSAASIAELIESAVPLDCELPRGYRVVLVRSNVGSGRFLVKGDPSEPGGYCEDDEPTWVDGIGGYLYGDFHCEVPSPTPEGLIEFADDVEGGLLDEIAEFLRHRAESMRASGDSLASRLGQEIVEG